MARTTFSGPVASNNGFLTPSTNGNGITIAAPSALAASYTITLPPNDGDNGQVLTTNGSGVTTWTTNGAGTVTSVAGTGTVSGLTLTGTVTSTGSLTLGGSLVLATSTAAAIGAVGNAINTSGKTVGKMVVDLSTGIIYTATGTAAAAPWGATTGTPVTPA
jgi:trimeric autotransporter adhesin